jgi:hypothetical protein
MSMSDAIVHHQPFASPTLNASLYGTMMTSPGPPPVSDQLDITHVFVGGNLTAAAGFDKSGQHQHGGGGLPWVPTEMEPESVGFVVIKVFLSVLYTIVFVLGIAGNSLVIYVVCRFSKMQTVTNLYILNLAVADECFLIGSTQDSIALPSLTTYQIFVYCCIQIYINI